MADARSFWIAAVAMAGLLGCGGPEAEIDEPAPASSIAPDPAPSADRAPGAIEVVEVLDGDTLDVRIDGAVERVRLIGVNAPERGECFAAEAQAALEGVTAGQELRLETDKSDRDQYDRLLRYVWAGDLLVNEQLVLGGFAIANTFEPDTKFAEDLDAAQARAMSDQVGQWGAEACGDATPDVELRIVEIEYDAPGDDGQNPNGEWVVITNDGARPVDLGGWILKDESSSHRFVFPNDVRLDAGSSLRVYSGCGSPTTTEFYWCASGSAIWNNSGDTAFLLDPVGNTVATLTY